MVDHFPVRLMVDPTDKDVPVCYITTSANIGRVDRIPFIDAEITVRMSDTYFSFLLLINMLKLCSLVK